LNAFGAKNGARETDGESLRGSDSLAFAILKDCRVGLATAGGTWVLNEPRTVVAVGVSHVFHLAPCYDSFVR
jgi:hypothetical protein